MVVLKRSQISSQSTVNVCPQKLRSQRFKTGSNIFRLMQNCDRISRHRPQPLTAPRLLFIVERR
jgi:hypothetical protein